MIIVLEHCPGCGICLKSCPVGALALNNGKAEVINGCIECGLCLKSCPVGQLIRTDTPAQGQEQETAGDPGSGKGGSEEVTSGNE